MKNLTLVFGTIIAFVAGSTLLTSCGSGNQNNADTSQHEMDNHEHDASMAATFACPMHPEITGKEGDKCSKCGMALVASSKDGEAMQDMNMSAMASCPMHPEITGKEGDKCSKCGMALVMAATADEDGEHQH